MPARAAYAAALAAVLPVEAQITALAPSRTAAETAQVMPRSLNEPVGLAPSSFRRTVAPTIAESTGARSSGVEPSCRLTSLSPALERQALVVALDQRHVRAREGRPFDERQRHWRRRSQASSCDHHELLFDHPDRARRRAHEVELADPLDRRAQARLEHRMGDHHQPRVLAHAALHDRLDRHARARRAPASPRRARPDGRPPPGAGRRRSRRPRSAAAAAAARAAARRRSSR